MTRVKRRRDPAHGILPETLFRILGIPLRGMPGRVARDRPGMQFARPYPWTASKK